MEELGNVRQLLSVQESEHVVQAVSTVKFREERGHWGVIRTRIGELLEGKREFRAGKSCMNKGMEAGEGQVGQEIDWSMLGDAGRQ